MSTSANITYVVLKAFKEAEESCASPWVLDYARKLPGTAITFHQLLAILGGIFCVFTTGICAYLSYVHMTNWTRPKEQKQIVRIIWYLPVYSILAVFSIWYYHLAGFLAPVGQWAGGFALTALFLLYIEIASPDGSTREALFDSLERRLFTGKKKGDKGSLRWFRGLNIMVFQLFFNRIATVLATELLYGLSCPLSSTRRMGQLAISIIQGFSTGTALWGCVLLEKRFHPTMQEHVAQLKLISFKTAYGLDAIQTMLFPTLGEQKVFTPKPPFTVSWNDFAFALPKFLLVIELFVSAVSFFWAFSATRYRQQSHVHKASIFVALRDVVNISDIWAGVAYAFWGRIPSSWSENTRTDSGGTSTEEGIIQTNKESRMEDSDGV